MIYFGITSYQNTKLWIQGNMTDNDYFSALQYFLDNKMITLNQYD